MIKLFDVANGGLVPTIHTESMETLQVIKKKYPKEYIKIYQFLFYMSCKNPDENPYFDVPEIEKEEVIMKQLAATFNTDDEEIREGVKFVGKLYETPLSRAYDASKIFLDKLSEIIKDTNISLGKDGNATELFAMVSKFDNVRSSFKGAFRDLQEEQKGSGRGNVPVAYDQR